MEREKLLVLWRPSGQTWMTCVFSAWLKRAKGECMVLSWLKSSNFQCSSEPSPQHSFWRMPVEAYALDHPLSHLQGGMKNWNSTLGYLQRFLFQWSRDSFGNNLYKEISHRPTSMWVSFPLHSSISLLQYQKAWFFTLCSETCKDIPTFANSCRVLLFSFILIIFAIFSTCQRGHFSGM